jgi:hypothetical protein
VTTGLDQPADPCRGQRGDFQRNEIDQLCEPLGAEKDQQTREAVLACVVDGFPAQFTIRALAIMLAGDLMDDSVERAVRDLVGAGLLRCNGRAVLPTYAATPAIALLGERDQREPARRRPSDQVGALPLPHPSNQGIDPRSSPLD